MKTNLFYSACVRAYHFVHVLFQVLYLYRCNVCVHVCVCVCVCVCARARTCLLVCGLEGCGDVRARWREEGGMVEGGSLHVSGCALRLV